MADYHSPTVIGPEIPVTDMTALERFLLEAVFEAEFDEDEDYVYFFSELGPSDQITVERDQLLAAFEESVTVADSRANELVAEHLRTEKREIGRDDRYVDIDMTEIPWTSVLQDIVKRSPTIPDIVVTTSFTCSRMRSDGFGGSVLLITADAILGKSTSGMLDDLREEVDRTISTPDAATRSGPASLLETRTFVVISTGHVSRQTAAILDATPSVRLPCVSGGHGEYGWFLYAESENSRVGDQRIPDDLFHVMEWVRRQGFRYVLLDRDGDRIDDLEWFDW